MATGNSPLGNMVIDVDLNTTKLNNSVTGLSRQMKQVNTAMRANLSGLKSSGSESDKLSTKVDGLNKKQKIQQEIVNKTEENYQKLVKTKGATAKETEAYASKLNVEQAKLREVNSQLSEVTNELKEMERQHKIMSSPWTKLNEGLDTYGTKLSTIGENMKSFGKMGMLYITAPVVGAFGASTKAAIDFDTAFAGVKKTVDTSEAGYQKLADGIRDMSKELPATASKIAGVAESAGQLGIEEENILSFSRTIIDLGEATNLTTEQAATEFARFANIMGMNQNEFSNLGSTVVALGNNMATTESEIMSMSMRLAGTGNQIGLTEPQVAALAATMSSVGIEAEAGGTAMSSTMKKMQNAVSAGGAELDGFAQVAGMSSAEFAEAFNNDPMTAITAFIQGLEESGASGENLNGILEGLGITGIRESDTLLRLAGNSDLLTEAVDISSNAWTENTALTDEAAQRYETMAAQLSILKNHLIDLGIDIGDMLLPYLQKFVDFSVELIEKVSGMSDKTKLFGLTFAGIAAVIPPVLFGLGAFIAVIGSAMSSLAPLAGWIARSGGLLKVLGLAFGALTSPVGLTIGIIALLATGFGIAYAKSATFRDGVHAVGAKVQEIWEYLKTFGSGVKNLFTGSEENGTKILSALGVTDSNIARITGLRDNIMSIKDKAIELGNSVVSQVKPALDSVMSFIAEVGTKLRTMWQENSSAIIPVVTTIGNIISTVFSAILSTIQFIMPAVFFVIKMVWENIQGVIRGGLKIIDGLVKVFSGLFTGNFSKMWEGVKSIFTGAIQLVWNGFQLLFYGRIIKGVGSLVKLFAGSIRSLWTNVVSFFKGMFSGATTQATNLFNKVISIGRNLNSGFNNIVSGMVRSVINFFKNLYTNITTTVGNIRSGVQNTFSAMKDFAVNSVIRLKDGAANGFNTLKTKAGKLVTDLKDNVAKQFTKMVDGAKALPVKLGSAISNGASKAVDGVKKLGNKMAGKLGTVVNGVIGGLNSITSKIGITATISKWNVPQFSTGTLGLTSNGAIAQDTLATVGDKGIGNGKGTRELVQYPNGTTGLYDNDATIFAPRGTVIYNNKQTEDILSGMPKFSKGTGAGSGAKNGNNKKESKGLLGGLKDVLANTRDYIKNPSKAFNAVIDNVAPNFSGFSGFAGTMVKGGFDFFKGKALDWITGIFKDNEGGDVDGGSILNRAITAKFGNYPANIAAQLGVTRHYGLDTAHNYEKLTSPVSGRVTKVWHDIYGGNAIQIKAGDLDWWFMHMKSIARSVGDTVKAGKTNLGITGNTGLRTTGYHLHTQAMRGGIGNGYAIDPLPLLKKAGYATGGLVGNGIYNLGEEGHPEWVIPTDPKRRTDAMKLLAYAGKSLHKNNGNLRPNNLPNINTGNDSNEELEVLKTMVLNQNKMIELLAQQVAKEPVALFNEKKLAKELEPEITKITKYNDKREARFTT